MSRTLPLNNSSNNLLSLTNSAFKDQAVEDPYLSATSDLEHLPFGSHLPGLRLGSSDPGITTNKISPVSPAVSAKADNRLMGKQGHDEYHLDVSTGYDFDLSASSDPGFFSSVQTSPSADDFLSFDGLDAQLASDINNTSEQGIVAVQQSEAHTFFPTQHKSLHDSAEMAQLMSPDLTHHPSPASDVSNTLHFAQAEFHDRALRGNQPTRLEIPDGRRRRVSLPMNSGADNLNVDPTPGSASAHSPSPSPVVRVSSYSRGDSPTGDDGLTGRRSSRLSNHLAPSHESDEVDNLDGDASRSVHGISGMRSDDGSWIPNPITGQAGIDPASREDIYVPSPKQMEEERRLAEKNADIQNWSFSVSEANSIAGDEMPPYPPHRERVNRRRAKSAGDYFTFHDRNDSYVDDANIPGPGALINETSDVSDSESERESEGSHPEFPVANALDQMGSPKEAFPALGSEEVPEEEPLARQFLRSYPWQDGPDLIPLKTKTQPATSTDAITRFFLQAENTDTASRSATWGTKKLSDAEVSSLLKSNTFFKGLSISTADVRSSLMRHLLPKKSNSNLKRRMSQTSQQPSSDEPNGQDNRGDPAPKPKPQRKLSFGRSKSPSFGAGSLVAAAIAGQVGPVAASVGGPGSFQTTSPTGGVSSLSPSSLTSRVRNRSNSEIPPSSRGRLIKPTSRGRGSTVSKTTSPVLKFPPAADKRLHQREEAKDVQDDVEDDDEATDDKGVVMDFSFPSQPIIPTLEGFRTQILQLNPRLQPALVYRFAQEQLRRYKRLVQDRTKHVRAVSNGTCGAGKRCLASGGQAELLPPRPSPRDPTATYCQFQIPGHEISDDDPNTPIDGAVTPAVFPVGVPFPPVKRLPAEFECSLCFKVKRLQKPSDWTKHIHEDILPFTCTFPSCIEPKSFKRKADWVRHENERHRQLEWWTCSMPDCDHTCYRKDNFVQHLVREHKQTEPKVKKTKSQPLAGSMDDRRYEEDIDRLWKQVEECHHETNNLPQDEPCRFCGNVCNDWKKLTVHLARHLEQIAMPILRLLEDSPPRKTALPGAAKPPTSRPQNTPSPISPATRVNIAPDAMAVKIEQGFDSNVARVPYYSETSHREAGLHLSPVSSYSNHLSGQNDPSVGQPGAGSSYPPLSHYTGASPLMMDSVSYLTPNLYTPMHRNSVSYPPPYNAMPPRPDPAATQANAFGLTVSTMEANATYDPQRGLHTSPTAENMYLYPDGIVPTNLYDGSEAMDYQSTVPTQENVVPSGTNFISHPQPSTYQFQ